MGKPLRVLLVEDSEQDALLLLMDLRRQGYSPTFVRVETEQEMTDALNKQDSDIILSDYVLPHFSGLDALQLYHRRESDLPFIVVSGQIGEDVAVEAMKAGAHDYIMKNNLRRLGAAIERELAEAENRKKRRQAEEELKRSAVELRALAHRLLQVQEEERRNIARELHDEIGQQMTLLKLLLEKTKRALGNGVPLDLDEAQQMTKTLTEQVRSMSLRLRPGVLDDLGLLPALEAQVQDFADKTGIRLSFEHSGIDERLTQDVRTCAYRVIQEALTNVVRHAKADHVQVLINAGKKSLAITIHDNGVGFNPANISKNSSGLRGARERVSLLGGTFNLESVPGNGTKITVNLPLGK